MESRMHWKVHVRFGGGDTWKLIPTLLTGYIKYNTMEYKVDQILNIYVKWETFKSFLYSLKTI